MKITYDREVDALYIRFNAIRRRSLGAWGLSERSQEGL
jgi:uncharacterized protein YuzE